MRIYTRDETPHVDSSLSDLLFPRLLRSEAVVQLMLAATETPHENDALSLFLPGMDAKGFSHLLRKVATQRFEPVELAPKMEVKTFDKFDGLLSRAVLNEINARDRLDLVGAKNTAANA